MKQIATHNGCKIFIARQADKDAQFWSLLGPVATSPDVHKALGGPLADSPSHVWLIAIKNGETVAVSSYQIDDKGNGRFNETYIIAPERGNGLYEKLFDLKWQLCTEDGAKLVKGMANSASKKVFEKRGWAVTRATVNWTFFEKAAI